MKEKKKKSPLYLYVIFSISMIVIFTVVMLIIFLQNQSIPDTLCTCFYAFFGGEITISGLIKIFKLKGENENDESGL